MITGIHHIAIIVASESSVAFYRQLGFQEFFRKERKNDSVVLMKGHGIELEIFIDSNHPKRSSPEPVGLRHLALKVDSIEKTIQELNLNSEKIISDWLGRKYCYINDPDGNIIELNEDRRRMKFDELWQQVNDLPNMAKIQIPGILTPSTKKKLSRLTPEEITRVVAAAIDEVNRGSIEPLDKLIRKRL